MRCVAQCVLAAAGLGLFLLPAQDRAPAYRVTGPFPHENLSVFLIQGSSRTDARRFLTLEEALAQKKIAVYETGNVNELAVENLSNQDVFIQSGDIVKGGQQDRTFETDLILPTGSGRTPIKAFCVEHGRWSRRGGESVRQFDSAGMMVASREMKMAVKSERNQSKVWKEVEQMQAKLRGSLGTGVVGGASPSSMQLTLENSAVRKSTDAYLRTLENLPAGKAGIVGYAFAINGKLNSAEVYASNELFLKLWPKLLRAAAVEAVAESGGNVRAAAPSAAEVEATLLKGDGAAKTGEVNPRTKVVTRESDRTMLFETQDRAAKDAWVHRSYIAK